MNDQNNKKVSDEDKSKEAETRKKVISNFTNNHISDSLKPYIEMNKAASKVAKPFAVTNNFFPKVKAYSALSNLRTNRLSSFTNTAWQQYLKQQTKFNSNKLGSAIVANTAWREPLKRTGFNANKLNLGITANATWHEFSKQATFRPLVSKNVWQEYLKRSEKTANIFRNAIKPFKANTAFTKNYSQIVEVSNRFQKLVERIVGKHSENLKVAKLLMKNGWVTSEFFYNSVLRDNYDKSEKEVLEYVEEFYTENNYQRFYRVFDLVIEGFEEQGLNEGYRLSLVKIRKLLKQDFDNYDLFMNLAFSIIDYLCSVKFGIISTNGYTKADNIKKARRKYADKDGVIVEYKRLLGNESEMMTKDNLNVKAFRELVVYYLRERIVHKNLEVKKGIVTNGYDFFVIDSNELEKYFYKNKKLVDLFIKFENKQLSDTKTDFLFDEVIAPAIDKALTKPIKIGYFDLRKCLKSNSNEFRKQDITRLYRFFSTENLLNEMVFADSNSLNKNFYNELLYIMGLHEEKKSGNKVISRFKEGKRQDASLIENTIEQLDINDVPESKQFDIAMQLNVVWINRILFLKLLESSLVSFNNSDDYKFLNSRKITSFDDLNELFFLVMAKKVEDRKDRIKEKFPYVPYMNSSLFERTELESSKDGININALREGEIEVYSKTKLRDANSKKLTGKIQILDYLFKFLNSYDFTSAVDAKSKKNQDQLINASVLGLIFEKINGYKDGSFFTPGKITMYMAKRAVRQAVLTKVNETLGWNAKNITELGRETRDIAFSIEDRKKVSDAIDTLKILDPAVGSGHFLVSVLNELIAIKAFLRVLFDTDGELLNDISCTVANDELIIQDEYGNNYSYDANKPKLLRIQKALFQQKKTIIENCLYGVDLNPNSVNICRLRLWIELLKNAYYSEDDKGNRYLTTLPNIDINIKVGDSLIHRYDLTDKFDLRKKDFKQYVELVKQYKDTSDKGVKAEINDKINSIKSTFVNSWKSPEAEAYDKALAELAGTTNLFDQNVDNKRIAELRQKVKEAKESFENRKGDPLYNNALEWRLEFPEVLDEDGNFVGFDIVIANPPYIFARNQSFDDKTKQYYLSHYEVDEYQANTYTLFMELGYKLLKKNGTFAYIVPNNMLTIQSNQKIRDFLLKKSGSLVIINSLDKIFADANVDNCLVFLKKEKSDEVTVGELNKGDFETVGTVDKNFFGKDNPIFSISMVKYRDAIGAYWKINKILSLEENNYAQVKTGIKAYQKGKGNPKQEKSDGDNRVYHSTQKIDDTYIPYVDGNNVSRYLLTWNGEYIKYGNNLAEPRRSTNFKEPRILVRQIPSKSVYSIDGVFTKKTIINDLNSMVIEDIKINPLTMLGIINSKVETLWFLMHFDKFQRRLFPQFKVNELAQFPVPDMSTEEQNKIADKVSVIMNKAQSKQDYSKENFEVDELVMDAYGLTEEEKQEVRNFTF